MRHADGDPFNRRVYAIRRAQRAVVSRALRLIPDNYADSGLVLDAGTGEPFG
ncbi:MULTISPECIES: hypothetical protein [Pseudomonas]|uniref:hypothetical protein n=1 Tax=Pseudomonas TaxID=286 RepID=UPI00163B4170|nr:MULTISPECIES: hypothetical protein [Pseudomonas]MDN3236710.1 hypothetical protein [Pseudomonas sp. WAC2]